MPMIVFLRGVNVGGHKKFQPSLLAKELAKFEVVNFGAAGTFIVHGKISAQSLRKEIFRRLPFQAEAMICTASEIADLVRSQPFGKKPPAKNVKWFVSILRDPPRTVSRLPIKSPAKGAWEVRVVRVTGKFACSLWRSIGRGILYPNEVVEKAFAVPATTRGWNTIISIHNRVVPRAAPRTS